MKNKKHNALQSILIRIIDKGGLYGMCAKIYFKNEKKAKAFVLECYDHCHIKSVREIWGEELINDIIKYKLECL